MFGRSQYHEWPPRTAATVDWSQSEPRRQVVCAAEERTGEVTQAPWRSPEVCDWFPEIGHELFILLDFDFTASDYTVLWLFIHEEDIQFKFEFCMHQQLKYFELLKDILNFWRESKFKVTGILTCLNLERLWNFQSCFCFPCEIFGMNKKKKRCRLIMIWLYVKLTRTQWC